MPRTEISNLNRSKIRKYASENPRDELATNEKAADEELKKQAQQGSGTPDAEDIDDDEIIVRKYFNEINTFIKSVLDTISLAECPRDKQQSMLEIIKKRMKKKKH